MSTSHRFRFRPRFQGLALVAMGLGAALVALGLTLEGGRTLAMGGGAAGIALGALYLLSPVWRFTVIVEDDALTVRSPAALRFRLAWDEITELVASPGTHTCFVNGGHPDRSLLVPGPGASAPYDIENKHELFALLCARTPRERIREVELLEHASAGEHSA